MQVLYGNDLVKELRKKSDNITERIWIAVPYIGDVESIKQIIGSEWINNPKISVQLLTDIDEVNNFNTETINLINNVGNIRHLSGLHAKIYITDKTCLITSANLTKTAFSKRHEIGIFLDENDSKSTISIFNDWWAKASKVSIEQLKISFDKFHESSEEKNVFHYKKIWELPEGIDEINYWLKPIGVTEDPITEDRKFNDVTYNLHFAVYPKSIKINDILIAYGIGAKRILSIYKVISGPEESKKLNYKEPWMKRWPWFVTGQNLTPNFGSEWSKYNLYASDLLLDFLKENPSGFITKVKGKTLGGLNYKRDKINLDPDFARNIIRKVKNLNKTH